MDLKKDSKVEIDGNNNISIVDTLDADLDPATRCDRVTHATAVPVRVKHSWLCPQSN